MIFVFNKITSGFHSGKDERGGALILALVMLSAFSVLAASAASASLYLAVNREIYLRNAREFYNAESAANRVVFYLKADCAKHPDRTLGENSADEKDFLFDGARWLADGIARRFTITDQQSEMNAVITDEAGYFPLGPQSDLMSSLTERRKSVNDGKMTDMMENISFQIMEDLFADFIDSDDSRRLNGMEEQDYAKAGMGCLPINREAELREELLYIPGFYDFCMKQSSRGLDFFQIIPPAGMSFPKDMKSLYSSDIDSIAAEAKLNEMEKNDVEAALKKWRTSQIRLSQSLSPALWNKLKEKLSIKESGIYRVRISPVNNPHGMKLNMVFQFGQ